MTISAGVEAHQTVQIPKENKDHFIKTLIRDTTLAKILVMEQESKKVKVWSMKKRTRVTSYTKRVRGAGCKLLAQQSEEKSNEQDSSSLNETKKKDDKSDILDFMENLRRYFEKRNLLDDYEFIVGVITNLSSVKE